MLHMVQAFGEYISQVEGSWYVFELNVTSFDTVAYIVMFHVYVFGA